MCVLFTTEVLMA